MEPHSIKDHRTDQAVQLPACSKLCAQDLTPILRSGTRPAPAVPFISPRKHSKLWASISVTMVSTAICRSTRTNGRQEPLDSYWKQTLCTEGNEESISWHATTRHLFGTDCLIVCVTSRDNSRNSILRYASLLTLRLNKSLSRKPLRMWLPTETHPLLDNFARSCFCCHPIAPGIFLESVLGGQNSTHPSSSPTEMLEDGWMWSLMLSSLNSIDVSSTSGWMTPNRPRNCFQLHYALNPKPQHLPSLMSWLTRRLCLHDQVVTRLRKAREQSPCRPPRKSRRDSPAARASVQGHAKSDPPRENHQISPPKRDQADLKQ